ncbi:MAG: hypothetical protein AABZ80_06295 [Gemmatimonadota bacterium]
MLRVVPPVPPLSAIEQFGLDVLLDLSRILVTAEGAVDGPSVSVVGASGGALGLAEARARHWGIQARDGMVTIERPLLTLAAELAGAAAEQRTEATDQYGRVPPGENALVRAGDERDPVVNRMALALRDATVVAAGRGRIALLAPWPEGKRWAMAMTHDLDVVALWPAYSALRLAQLLSHGDVARAGRVAAHATAALLRNPVWRAADQLLSVERRHGIRSTWFAIAGTPTPSSIWAGDVTYVPESPSARRILAAAAAGGHEVGLHGSFASFTFADVFKTQRSRLAAIGTAPLTGVRQHFLRMRPGVTHAAMVDAGFAYDSTFGFSERNGFRLGVADVVPVWDDQAKRTLGIDEAPFVWMDRALSKYRHVEDPGVWITDALAIASTVRQVDGLWTGIWHPNMDPALGFPDAPAAFEKLCSSLMSESPWATTLGAAVAWRRARRQARAVGATASGEIRLRAPAGETRLALEGPDGKPIRHQPA